MVAPDSNRGQGSSVTRRPQSKPGRETMKNSIGILFAGFAAASAQALAADPLPKGFSSFGPDQTIADVGKVDWQPLKLEGLPPGIEIATLRGDLAKGGAEILLRLPAKTPCQTTAIPVMSCM